MKPSKIGWADVSGGDCNFVTGCTPASEGCAHCYAQEIYRRYGRDFSKVETHEDKLMRLLKTKRWPEVSKRGGWTRPLVFVCDTGDLFHPDVPASFITYAFEVMAAQTAVDWAVLTKRPERINPVLFGAEGGWFLGGGDYISNVWLGVTGENQARAYERIPYLMEWQGVRWVSVEPMLEEICLRRFTSDVQWVVCGGESGPARRWFDVTWALTLFDACEAGGAAFFYKQGSGPRPGMYDELPGCGRVQEWPESR